MRKIINSIKLHLDIKGRIRDLLNPYALITSFSIGRARKVNLSNDNFLFYIDKVENQIDLKKSFLLASVVWRKTLKKRLNKIYKLIKKKEIDTLKDIYENLFLSDMMTGAISHEIKISKLSRLSQGTRFHRRFKILKGELVKIDSKISEELINIINSEIYNFGRPLTYKKNGEFNIECLDELYFALFITNFLKNNFFDEIVFIGDGAGFLSPLITSSVRLLNPSKITSYVIVDFFHFAISTAIRNNMKNIKILLPEKLHKFKDNEILSGKLPLLKGKRLIINQDSFPEMSLISLRTYLKNTADETFVLSYNQLASNAGKNHCDHLGVLKEMGYKKIITKHSKLRDNYFLSAHKVSR